MEREFQKWLEEIGTTKGKEISRKYLEFLKVLRKTIEEEKSLLDKIIEKTEDIDIETKLALVRATIISIITYSIEKLVPSEDLEKIMAGIIESIQKKRKEKDNPMFG